MDRLQNFASHRTPLLTKNVCVSTDHPLAAQAGLGMYVLLTRMDIVLAVNTGKTKYMETGLIRGMMTNEHITIGSNSYEKVKTFKYLGSLLTNENSI